MRRGIALLAAVALLPCLSGCGAEPSPASPGRYSLVRPGSAWNAPLPNFSGAVRCRAPRRPAPASGGERPAAGLAVSLNWVSGKGLCGQLARAQASGARLIRDDLVWADVEPSEGAYRWKRYDTIVANAARYG